MFAIVLALAVGSSPAGVVEDRFDMIEVNRFYNEYGSPVFSQMIFWDWCEDDNTFHVQGWILMGDAWDDTDPEHQKQYEAEVDRWLENIRDAGKKSSIRQSMPYKGKFVGGRMYPAKNYRTGLYESKFLDKGGVMRIIRAPLFRQTDTQTDPERDDRVDFHEEQRRGLKQVSQNSQDN